MKRILGLCIIAICFLSSGISSAAIYEYELGTVYSGFAPISMPPSVPPWITAKFEDTQTPGIVKLTMSASDLYSGEFVAVWAFNFDPSMDASKLTFTPDAGGYAAQAVLKGNNSQNADGDQNYDIRFEFYTNSQDRFEGGMQSIYLIAYSGTGLDASDFNFKSDPGNPSLGGPFITAAHIQGIRVAGYVKPQSGWISAGGSAVVAPEPGTMLLLGLGLIGIAIVMRELL